MKLAATLLLLPLPVAAIACHPATSGKTWTPQQCAAAPQLPGLKPSATFPGPALPANWTVEGTTSGDALVVCAPPSTERMLFRAGPLAAAYEGGGRRGRLAQLGGSYWRARYDIGATGACHLDTGSLTHVVVLSPPLTDPGQFVSVLVGGGGGPATRVELCRQTPSGCEAIAGGVAGPGTLGMERVGWDLEKLGAASAPVRLRVAVRSTGAADEGLGFLLVDDLQRSDAAPASHPARLWGFVDLHAHIFNHLGSGGRLIHGAVFADDPKLTTPGERIERALGRDCIADHALGGHTFSVEPLAHGTTGYPSFADWPRFDAISHQSAYIDWIERAYRGGLRLVQMDVGNNRTYAAAYEQMNADVVAPLPEASRRPGDGRFTRSADEDVVRAEELAMMRRFVEPGGPATAWAGVAYDSTRARELAREGKLVIVPGVESDDPGPADDVLLGRANHMLERDARRVVRTYVEKLWGEGIRHVFPVHVMSNVFGDTAVYDRTIYCAGLPEQGGLTPMVNGMADEIRYQVELDTNRPAFIEFLMTSVLDPLPRGQSVRDRNAVLGSFARGDCHKWNFPDLRAFDSLRVRAEHTATIELPATIAKRGLTKVGRLFVEESMRLGMIIDITHASLRARHDILAIAEAHDYPVMAGHVNLRELSLGNRARTAGACAFAPPEEPYTEATTDLYGTTDVTKVAYEYAITRSELLQVKALGGMIGLAFEISGVGVQWAPADPTGKPTKLDCDGTSKSFAQPYRYVRDLMKGRNIGFGTDVNGFYKLPAPRFGARACDGAAGDEPRSRPGRGNERGAQTNRVVYGCGDDAMMASTAGQRRFDVNEDGVAHYGMLPDFLQDLENVGVSPEELTSMFGGLEDYLEMWAKCEAKAAELRKTIP